MTENGVNPLTLKNRVEDYSLPGGYRKLIERPKNLEWKFVPYDDATQPLILTDYEILEKKELQLPTEGAFTALQMSFQLASSTYATMCFRELFKTSTSIAHQTRLTSAHP